MQNYKSVTKKSGRDTRIMYKKTGIGKYDAAVKTETVVKNKLKATPYTVYLNDVSPVQMLPINTDREYIMIQNNSLSSIYVAFNNSPTTASLEIVAGGYREIERAPNNELWGLGTLSSQTIIVEEHA